MQTLLLKLQADVEARKQPRADLRPLLRTGAVAGVLFFAAFQWGAWSGRRAAADGLDASYAVIPIPGGARDLQNAELDRLRSAYVNSARYRIPADLALAIEDAARAEEIDVRLAFELVRTESEFNARAVSPVGAVGYTQLMPATARRLQPGISRQQMFERETNLRLGFRFLRYLVKRYDGDVKLALLAYNRGPERVDQLRRMGIDPSNGYVQLVLGRGD